jgi:phosphate starvation-inducible PhoH-like protein
MSRIEPGRIGLEPGGIEQRRIEPGPKAAPRKSQPQVSMSEATLAFPDQNEIRTLFGARDEYLRKMREVLGIDVVLRGEELRLKGDDENVRRGLEVFQKLRRIFEESGQITDADVGQILQAYGGNGVVPADGIDVFAASRKVHPRSEGQAEYVRAIDQNDLVFCIGPAGCGKTYLAVAKAVNALRTEQARKIVLVRPAVEAGEKLGFLPGDIFAKVNPYLRPVLDALHDILDYETVKRYMERDVVEIAPLAFMRGRTLNNTFIILDEGQNTTVTQMKMFLTRMGNGSKVVVTGDVTQVDLPPHVACGLTDAMVGLDGIERVGIVEMTGRDIVRHRLVKEIVRAYEKDGQTSRPRRK